MIIEKITVTTTPTSIAQLVATARSATLGDQLTNVRGEMQLNVSKGQVDDDILLEEADTATPIVILQSHQSDRFASGGASDVDPRKALLSVASGTALVSLYFSRGQIS